MSKSPKQVDESKVLPPGSFIFPQAYIESLMKTALTDFEVRAVKEISRLEIWVTNLQTQLAAAHEEIERLTKDVETRNGEPTPIVKGLSRE